jgi:starch phosphorylase
LPAYAGRPFRFAEHMARLDRSLGELRISNPMAVDAWLVRGSDIWLNHPLRPLEACGTSGMKAALNGGLNLSVLDGWWAEACEHGVNGWAIGDDQPGDDDSILDALHRTLEQDVMPAWKDSPRWSAMVRASIEMAATRFTADRMVREYFARLYDPSVSPAAPESVGSSPTSVLRSAST